MMNEKNLSKSYWAKAANTTIYLMNKCTTSGVHDITPHEKFFGKKQDLSYVRVFGAIAYVHIPDDTRQKLDPKSEKCILVGYSLEQKGYKCYNPSTRKVRISRDVVFDESTSWYAQEITSTQTPLDTDDAEIGYSLLVQTRVYSSPNSTTNPTTDFTRISAKLKHRTTDVGTTTSSDSDQRTSVSS